MKSIFILLSVVFLFLSCGENEGYEVGNKTTMEVETIFDAGDVVKGEMVTAKFVIKNTGSYPLVIGEVVPACSCTISDKPDAPIQPGKTGEVVAYVNTDKVPAGILHKSVRIVANTKPSVTEVIIKANVIRK